LSEKRDPSVFLLIFSKKGLTLLKIQSIKFKIKAMQQITLNVEEKYMDTFLAYLKTLKYVKVQPAESEKDYGDKGVPQHVADAIVEGLDWIEKRKRGEVKAISWEQMIQELKEEEQEVERV
jgi:vacuolar-type H+-ATPase subunit I/STV1